MASNNRQLKEAKVQEIREKLEKAQSFILADYQGLNVEEDTQLRKISREAGVEYKVYKNKLVRLACNELGIKGLDDYLVGPISIAFGYEDPVAPAKLLSEFAKEHKKLELKAGLVDGKVIDEDGVKSLASLPSREVLIAQVLGGLNAPISGFVNVLQGNMRNLVCALNAIKEKQEA
ncbi:50S ribosomal protein L10 [Clostridium sp. DL1XJH146]